MSKSDQLVSAVRLLPADQQAALVAALAGDIVRSNDTLRAEVERLAHERDQLHEQLAKEREYTAGLRKVIEIKNKDARAL